MKFHEICQISLNSKDHLQEIVTLCLIYQLIRAPAISVRYFCLIKMLQFCVVYQIKSNVHLLYSFIHVFIHNSITKCFWQTFGKGI